MSKHDVRIQKRTGSFFAFAGAKTLRNKQSSSPKMDPSKSTVGGLQGYNQHFARLWLEYWDAHNGPGNACGHRGGSLVACITEVRFTAGGSGRCHRLGGAAKRILPAVSVCMSGRESGAGYCTLGRHSCQTSSCRTLGTEHSPSLRWARRHHAGRGAWMPGAGHGPGQQQMPPSPR